MACTCAARAVRFDGRKIGLYLLECGKSIEDLCNLRWSGGSVFCDCMHRGLLFACFWFVVFGVLLSCHVDVDEGTEAVVLAKVTTGVFISRRAVANICNRLETDECG